MRGSLKAVKFSYAEESSQWLVKKTAFWDNCFRNFNSTEIGKTGDSDTGGFGSAFWETLPSAIFHNYQLPMHYLLEKPTGESSSLGGMGEMGKGSDSENSTSLICFHEILKKWVI